MDTNIEIFCLFVSQNESLFNVLWEEFSIYEGKHMTNFIRQFDHFLEKEHRQSFSTFQEFAYIYNHYIPTILYIQFRFHKNKETIKHNHSTQNLYIPPPPPSMMEPLTTNFTEQEIQLYEINHPSPSSSLSSSFSSSSLSSLSSTQKI